MQSLPYTYQLPIAAPGAQGSLDSLDVLEASNPLPLRD